MDDMHTRNSSSMHDELVLMVEAKILLLFDCEIHTYAYIQHSLDVDVNDVDVKILNEALDSLVNKGLLHRTECYYELTDKVQKEINFISHRGFEELIRYIAFFLRGDEDGFKNTWKRNKIQLL